MKKLLGVLLVLGCVVFLSPGCYTLKSTTIPPELKTINIGFFENNAQLVVPTLAQQFTEALKDRVRTTTRLSVVNNEANATMTGAIVDYRIAPFSIQATNNNVAPIAGASQLTISVHVKFVYSGEKPSEKMSFDQNFSKSETFTGDIAASEQTLIAKINKELVDDIINKAFDNW